MFGQKPRSASVRQIKARLTEAEIRREAIIDAIIDSDESLLFQHEQMDPLYLEDLSIEVDALQAEIDLCTYELRARMWAESGQQARALRAETRVDHAHSPGFARTLLRLLKGAPAHAA